MKTWLALGILLVAVMFTGCSKSNPAAASTDPTATVVPPAAATATATATPVPGGGVGATVTPTAGGTPIATATPRGGTYTVKYEVTTAGVSSSNITYLDSDTTSASVLGVPAGTWSQTVTLGSGFEAQMIIAFAPATASPSMVGKIFVDGVEVISDSRSAPSPAVTISYWLP
ncbi:MAG: hypothetical protein HGA76_02680 [Candidatus Firestonebacteria bacterium]|nr:hypothetical protein [Candidatus Firestonebacteria bacterium]